jgi:hypothetical protein
LLGHGDQIKVGESVFLSVANETGASDASVIELDDRVLRSTAQLHKEDIL